MIAYNIYHVQDIDNETVKKRKEGSVQQLCLIHLAPVLGSDNVHPSLGVK